jgi:acyl carrier protein
MDVRASVSGFIRSEFSAALGGASLADDTQLIESGIVDSLGIMKLLQYLEDSFSIHIGDDELRPENFETPGRIVALVEQKLASH